MDVAEAVAELEKLGVRFEVGPCGEIYAVFDWMSNGLIPDELVQFVGTQEFSAYLLEIADALRRADAKYAEVFDAAVVSCARMIHALPGMMPWLRKEHPALYDDISRRLPDFVSRLWDAQAPLPDFRRGVRDIEQATTQAAELYLAGREGN